MSLDIKDGNGLPKTLKTTQDISGDLIPHHIVDGTIAVTSSLANPLAVSITGTVFTTAKPVKTVSKTSVTSFSWDTAASGTFLLASENEARKGLTIFNPGPNSLFIALSTNGGTTNGFILDTTASAPLEFTTVIFPSGTYMADETTVGVYHGGYFISGSFATSIFVSSIT